MPRYIVKLPGDRYLEWSTVVDAPVTYGMSRDEFYKYYRTVYGFNSLNMLDIRMKKVDRFGCSSGETLEELVSFNRAGKDESSLSLSEIIASYAYPPRVEND